MPWQSPPSVQVVPGVGVSATNAAQIYFDWITQRLPAVHTQASDAAMGIYVWGSSAPAILLEQVDAKPTRAAFVVVGGYLVAREPGGTFVFTKDGPTLTMALKEFAPRLPRLLYLMTHHLIHSAVMSAFCRYIRQPQLEDMSL